MKQAADLDGKTGGRGGKEAGIKYFLQKREEMRLIPFRMPGRGGGIDKSKVHLGEQKSLSLSCRYLCQI
jgi:hypothetical protein